MIEELNMEKRLNETIKAILIAWGVIGFFTITGIIANEVMRCLNG